LITALRSTAILLEFCNHIAQELGEVLRKKRSDTV
jgi:hypothetical protein